MIDLLMLGIIPGTNIQINFADWLLISAGIGLCVCTAIIIRQRRQLARLILHGVQLARRTVLHAVGRIQLPRQLRKTVTVL